MWRAVSRFGRALALLTGLALTSVPVQAETGDGARAAARQMQEAITALDAARGARDQVAALTKTIRAYEQGLTGLRDSLRGVTIREQTLRAKFDGKRDRIGRLLGVMTAMERSPGPLLLLHPSGPLGTAQSGMMLAAITPALQAEVETLRGELQEVAMLRSLQQSSADMLQTGLRAVQDARTALSQAVSDRVDLPRRFADSPDDLAALVAGAETLEGFAELLSDTQLGPEEPVRRFEDARGEIALPVLGTVLRGYDATDAAGIRRPGLVLATRPRALVTAPWPATIRYRGPLLDYGNVIILEPGGGYLMVLAGLDILYGDVGQVLPAGTPVGLMGGADPEASEFLAISQEGGGEDRTETLYLELRLGKTPVDPTEWFAETKE